MCVMCFSFLLEDFTEEEKVNIAFQVLPLLFPTGMKKVGKKGPTQRATICECARSFVAIEKVSVK